MISAGDFRNGVTLEIDGQVVQVIEFQHVKPGKGAAFVRTKLKNVINGGVVERTFRPTEKFPQARIDRVDMQYLYADGDLYNFMNMDNYEQLAISSDIIGATEGSYFDATQTVVFDDPDGHQYVKVVSWYDNEYSFTCQYVRLAGIYGKVLGCK